MTAVSESFQLPDSKAAALAKAERVEWTAIGFLTSIVLLLAFVMGSSQTMKAMWVEDTLSMIPSISFLIGVRFRRKPAA